MTQAAATPIAQYHDEEAWLAERATGIGGSEVAAVFGEHPFITARELWERKTGKRGPETQTAIMERGRVLEPVAADLYAQKTGRRLRRMPMRRHPEYPWLITSIDRQILAGEDNPTAACELKVPGWQVFNEVRRLGLRPYMILQGMQESLVPGYPFTGFGIFHPDSWKILTFDVEADPAVHEMIVNEVGDFWHNYVEKDVPPPEPDFDGKLNLPTIEGEIQQRTDEEWKSAAERWREAKDIADEAGAMEKEAREELRGLMPGFGAVEGFGVRCYLSQRDGNRQYAQEMKALQALRPLDPAKVQAVIPTIVGPQKARQLIEALGDARVDFAELEKRGAPIQTFRPYVLKGA